MPCLPVPSQLPATAWMGGAFWRQERLWLRVLLSVRTALAEQEGSTCHGGVQVTTRHWMGPMQAMWLEQLPDRKEVRPGLRWSQRPLPHPQWVPLQAPLQIPPPPQLQPPQGLWQSM